MKRKRLIGTKPETYELALIWFIQTAPKFYLCQIDYQLKGMAQTRSRMTISQTQTCWRNWKGFTKLYDRCKFLLMVQSVYFKLEREFLGLQESISCNLFIGWSAGIVQAFENILVQINVKNGDYNTICKVKLQCKFKKLYSYEVIIKWDELLPQLHPSFARFKNGDDLHITNCMDHNITCTRFVSIKHSLGCHIVNIDTWAEMDYASDPHNTCLFTICPLTDFVLHHVLEKTQTTLSFFPNVLVDTITSYIGVTNVEDIW